MLCETEFFSELGDTDSSGNYPIANVEAGIFQLDFMLDRPIWLLCASPFDKKGVHISYRTRTRSQVIDIPDKEVFTVLDRTKTKFTDLEIMQQMVRNSQIAMNEQIEAARRDFLNKQQANDNTSATGDPGASEPDRQDQLRKNPSQRTTAPSKEPDGKGGVKQDNDQGTETGDLSLQSLSDEGEPPL